MSWSVDAVPVFDPPSTHPGWAGASPTPTMDIVFFEVHPEPTWQAFGIQYEGLEQGDLGMASPDGRLRCNVSFAPAA